MRFETFSYYKRTKKSEENSSSFWSNRSFFLKFFEGILDSAGEEEKSFYATGKYESPDKQKFAIIVCRVNPRDDEFVGQKIALELGNKLMREYVEQGDEFDRHQAFGKMCQCWRNELARAYGIRHLSTERESLYQQCAPSFMAIGGCKDRVLLAQCGKGSFMIEKDHKPEEFSLSGNNNDQYERGVNKQNPLYFREYSLKSVKKVTHFIPDKAIMIIPYRTNLMRKRFLEFARRTEKEDYEDWTSYRRYCLDPLKDEIKDMEQQQDIPIAIAGYWTLGKRSTSAPNYGPQYTEQRDPGYSGKTVSPQKKTPSWSENFLKKQEQNRQEQYRQKLNRLKNERYTAEAELQQLKQMQSNMQKQQQNLEAEHDMTIKWVQAQRKYLDSKKVLNHSPHD